MSQKGKLLITRHGESKWNKAQKWTGQYDADLSPLGSKVSKEMADMIKNIKIDRAITSELKRSFETLEIMLKEANKKNLEIERYKEINERDYGDYTGKNKWKMKEFFGEEKFNKIRRDWNCPVPNGETLKIVYERVIPFYLKEILPDLLKGKNIFMVAHTNSIRALLKYIENISDEEIKDLEIPFGRIFIYEVDKNGRMETKETKELDQK